MNDRRWEDLEIKVAHLERTSQELGDLVYRQQRELEALRARLQSLADRLDSDGGPAPAGTPERPPHY